MILLEERVSGCVGGVVWCCGCAHVRGGAGDVLRWCGKGYEWLGLGAGGVIWCGVVCVYVCGGELVWWYVCVGG